MLHTFLCNDAVIGIAKLHRQFYRTIPTRPPPTPCLCSIKGRLSQMEWHGKKLRHDKQSYSTNIQWYGLKPNRQRSEYKPKAKITIQLQQLMHFVCFYLLANKTKPPSPLQTKSSQSPKPLSVSRICSKTNRTEGKQPKCYFPFLL